MENIDFVKSTFNRFLLNQSRQIHQNRTSVGNKPQVVYEVVKLHLDEDDRSDQRSSYKSSFMKHLRRHTGQKSFPCEICHKQFSHKVSLIRHLQGHTAKKTFKREVCQKQLYKQPLRRSFIGHLQNHAGENEITSEICQMQSSLKSGLQLHLCTQTDEKKCSCKMCRKQFSQQVDLILKPFACRYCQERFTNKREMETHFCTLYFVETLSCKICDEQYEKESGKTILGGRICEKKFSCKICNDRFVTRRFLLDHYRSHVALNSIQCSYCKKIFSCKEDVKWHLRQRHMCKRCNAKIPDKKKSHSRKHTEEKHPSWSKEKHTSWSTAKTDAKMHLNPHSIEKPFMCKFCKEEFYNEMSLKIHLRVHSDEKEFSCEICKKQFSKKRNYKLHLRIHSEAKPLECKICKQQFIQKWDLKRHLQKHPAEKLFKCKTCQKQFFNKISLSLHLRQHSEEPPLSGKMI